jgi:acyl-CoA thioesterase YciA
MADTREPTLRVTMLPRDTNARGTIFGGVILSHIDFGGIAVALLRQTSRHPGCAKSSSSRRCTSVMW